MCVLCRLDGGSIGIFTIVLELPLHLGWLVIIINNNNDKWWFIICWFLPYCLYGATRILKSWSCQRIDGGLPHQWNEMSYIAVEHGVGCDHNPPRCSQVWSCTWDGELVYVYAQNDFNIDHLTHNHISKGPQSKFLRAPHMKPTPPCTCPQNLVAHLFLKGIPLFQHSFDFCT